MAENNGSRRTFLQALARAGFAAGLAAFGGALLLRRTEGARVPFEACRDCRRYASCALREKAIRNDVYLNGDCHEESKAD